MRRFMGIEINRSITVSDIVKAGVFIVAILIGTGYFIQQYKDKDRQMTEINLKILSIQNELNENRIKILNIESKQKTFEQEFSVKIDELKECSARQMKYQMLIAKKLGIIYIE